VDTLIILAEKGSLVTSIDVLVNGLQSTDPTDQQKAREFFRAKTKGITNAVKRETAAPAALVLA